MKRRKLLALLLSLVLLLSMLPTAALAEEDDTATRAFVAEAIAERFGWIESQEPLDQLPFDDIWTCTPEEQKAIVALQSRGLLPGTGDGHFSPDGPVERFRLAGLIWQALGAPVADVDQLPFRDVSWSDDCADAVSYLFGEGAIALDGEFRPNQNATEGEVEDLLRRATEWMALEQGLYLRFVNDRWQDGERWWAADQGWHSGVDAPAGENRRVRFYYYDGEHTPAVIPQNALSFPDFIDPERATEDDLEDGNVTYIHFTRFTNENDWITYQAGGLTWRVMTNCRLLSVHLYRANEISEENFISDWRYDGTNRTVWLLLNEPNMSFVDEDMRMGNNFAGLELQKVNDRAYSLTLPEDYEGETWNDVFYSWTDGQDVWDGRTGIDIQDVRPGLRWRWARSDGHGHWFEGDGSPEHELWGSVDDEHWLSFYWFDGERDNPVTADQLRVSGEGVRLRGVDGDSRDDPRGSFVRVFYDQVGEFAVTYSDSEGLPVTVHVSLPDAFYTANEKTLENLIRRQDDGLRIDYNALKGESEADPTVWWIGPASGSDLVLNVGVAPRDDCDRFAALEPSRLEVDRREEYGSQVWNSIGVTLPDPGTEEWDGEYRLGVYRQNGDMQADAWVTAPVTVEDNVRIYVNANREISYDGEEWFPCDTLRNRVFEGQVTVEFTEGDYRWSELFFENCSFQYTGEGGSLRVLAPEDCDAKLSFRGSCSFAGVIAVQGEPSDDEKDQRRSDLRLEELNGASITTARRLNVNGGAAQPITINGVEFDARAYGEDEGFGIGASWEPCEWDNEGNATDWVLTYYADGENYWVNGQDGSHNEARPLRVSGNLNGKRLTVSGVTDVSAVTGGELYLNGGRGSYVTLGGSDLRVDGRIRSQDQYLFGSGTVYVDNVYAKLIVNGVPLRAVVEDDNGEELRIRLGDEDLNLNQDDVRLEYGENGVIEFGEQLRLEDGVRLVEGHAPGEDPNGLRLRIAAGDADVVYEPLSWERNRWMSLGELAERLADDFLDGWENYDYNSKVFRHYPNPDEQGFDGNQKRLLAFLIEYGAITEEDYDEWGWRFDNIYDQDARYPGVLRALRKIYQDIWRAEGETADLGAFQAQVYIDGWDADNNDFRVQMWSFDRLSRAFRGLLPREAVQENVTVARTEQGLELRRGNEIERLNGDVSNRAFHGTVTVVCEQDNGGVDFYGCEFNGKIILQLSRDRSYNVFFDDACSFGPTAEISTVGQTRKWVNLYYHDSLLIDGVSVDTESAGTDDFLLSVFGYTDGDGGPYRAGLKIATGAEHDEERGWYRTDVQPIRVWGGLDGFDELQVIGYVDVTGVDTSAGGTVRQWSDWNYNESAIDLGGNELRVWDGVWGDQFYCMDGGTLTLEGDHPNVNVRILRDREAAIELYRAKVSRWSPDWNTMSYEVRIDAQNLPENLSARLVLDGREIGPENYWIERDDGGINLVPNFGMGEALFWPEDDESANRMEVELRLPQGTVRWEHAIFFPWEAADLAEFAGMLRSAAQDAGYETYHNYEADDDALCAVWPDWARGEGEDQRFEWRGGNDHDMLSFAVEMGGIQKDDYASPDDPIRYGTALAMARAVWTELKGNTPLPENVCLTNWDEAQQQDVPCPEDEIINQERMRELIWNRFSDVLKGVNTLDELVTALEQAKLHEAEHVGSDAEIRVTGSIVIDAAGLAPHADKQVVSGSELTIPAIASVTVREGGSLTVAEGATLTIASGAIPTDNNGKPVFTFHRMDWGMVMYEHTGTRTAVDGGGTLTVNGTLNIGAFRWVDNNGIMTVGERGRIAINSGEKLAEGYLNETADGFVYDTESGWSEERGEDGWEVIHSGGSINNGADGFLKVAGLVNVGSYSAIHNDGDVWISGTVQIAKDAELNNNLNYEYDRYGSFSGRMNVGCVRIDESGVLELDGRLNNRSGYESSASVEHFRYGRAYLQVAGLLTTDTGESDPSFFESDENYQAQINNSGEIEIEDGGVLLVGPFDELHNNAWAAEDGSWREAALLTVAEGGELKLRAADLYNNDGRGERATLRLDGKLTMYDGIVDAENRDHDWTPAIHNSGLAEINGQIDQRLGNIRNYGEWRQNGSLTMGATELAGETRGARFFLNANRGGVLQAAEDAAISQGGQAEFRVIAEENGRYDAEGDRMFWLGSIDKPAAPESVRPIYTALTHSAEGVLAAAEAGFDACYVDGVQTLLPRAGAGQQELSFDLFEVYGPEAGRPGAVTIGPGLRLRTEKLWTSGTIRVAGGELYVDGTKLTAENVSAAEKIEYGEDEQGERLGEITFAGEVPLRLELSYSKGSRSATLSVVTTEAVSLASYSLRLGWDGELFTFDSDVPVKNELEGMTLEANPAKRLVSACSANANNLSIPADTTLLSLQLKMNPQKELRPGVDYPFTVFVESAADQASRPLSWAGTGATGALRIKPLTAADFDNRSNGAATVNFSTNSFGDFALSCKDPCVALYYNGEDYQVLEGAQCSVSTYSYILPEDYDAAQPIVVSLKCDITTDGAIESDDALQVMRCAVELRTPTAEEILICDLDDDSELLSNEALQILRYKVELPNTLSW